MDVPASYVSLQEPFPIPINSLEIREILRVPGANVEQKSWSSDVNLGRDQKETTKVLLYLEGLQYL